MAGLGAALVPLGDTSGNGINGVVPTTAAVRFEDKLSVAKRYNPTMTENLGLNQAQVAYWRKGVTIAESLNILPSQTLNMRYAQLAAEVLNLASVLAAARGAAISDVLQMHEAFVVARGAIVIEALNLASVLGVNARYSQSLIDLLYLHDDLRRFFGLTISEQLFIAPTQARQYRAFPTTTENLGLHDTPAASLVLRVTTSDVLNISATQALKAIYNGTLLDAVNFNIAYIAPNGNFTTWAMNTRSAAVTEYSNFAFESFAQLGTRYIGARSDGLYELDGDTDAGTNIIATMRSGLNQMTGSHLGGIKAAYLAARGTGNWVLRIITGHGEVYNYGVTNQSMRSTKIHIGKGLRARYFAFELVSSGQDFDLESLEFIPILVDRRV